jgi:hypothetical protein
MDRKINQEESPENRPNFRCQDETVFIYAKERGVYEAYEKSEEDRDKAGAAERKKSSNPFVKYWGKPMRFWITTIVSLAGVIVVGLYTYYARQQWCATQKEATEAHNAVDASTHAMKLDERSWVAVATFEPAKECTWKVIVFRNTGRSAALNFHVSGAVESGTGEQAPEVQMPGTGLIAPEGEFKSCLGDSRTAGVHGRITYDDVFGTSHWTTFCYRKSKENLFAACDTGNDMDRNGIEPNR